MKLHELSPAEGSVKPAWRKGRGPGSGNGKTAGKGHKGQNARSGFNNRFAKEYAIVNLDALNSFNDGDTVNLEALMSCGKIKKALDGLKILGNGEITKKITVQAKVFSKSAKEKIEAAGGKAEVI